RDHLVDDSVDTLTVVRSCPSPGGAGGCRSSPRAVLRAPPGLAEYERADDDERHAQYLSRVHAREDDRSLLGELQEESGEKHAEEKEAAEDPLRRLPPLPGQQQSEAEHDVPQTLVDLDRMPRERIDAIEDHGPRHARRLAEDFRIDQVAEPHARGRERNAGHSTICDPPKGFLH